MGRKDRSRQPSRMKKKGGKLRKWCIANNKEKSEPILPIEDPPQDNYVYDLMPASDIYNAINITGRRTVSMSFFKSEIMRLNAHDKLGFKCNFNDMVCIHEHRQGGKSIYTYKCKMCNHEDTMHTEDPHDPRMGINIASVSGVMSTGGGYASLHEISLNLNMPSMSETTYRRYQEKVSDLWIGTALDAMHDAVQEEISLCKEKDEFGFPLLTVVVDGAYGKRSYRTNYKSLYGVVSNQLKIV